MLTPDCDLNIVTGEVGQSIVDYFFCAKLPCYLSRRYSSELRTSGIFGFGWTHNLDLHLRFDGENILMGGDGKGEEIFTVTVGAGYATDPSKTYQLRFLDTEWIVEEANGKAFVFDSNSTPDGKHRLIRRQDLDGNQIIYRYDKQGLISRIVDSHDREIYLLYNSNKRVIRIEVTNPTHPQPIKIAAFSYNKHDDLVASEGRSDKPMRYEYVDHRMVSITNRRGGATYFAYDGKGHGIARWRSDGSLYRRIDRDTKLGRVRVINSYGYEWLLQVNEQGRVIRETNPLHRVRENIYDTSGKLVFSGFSVIGPPCVTAMDEEAMTETTTCGGNKKVVTYNEFGKPVRIADAKGNAWEFEYDEKGHLIRETTPTGTEIRFKYSRRGEITEVTGPNGNVIRISEEDFSISLSDSLGFITRIIKDLFLNPILMINSKGDQVKFERDQAGNPIQVTWPDGGVVTFAYDDEGTPTEVIYPSGAGVLMESNEFGRPNSVTDPNGGNYTIKWGLEEDYLSIKNPRGVNAYFKYDAVGRLIEVTHYDGRRTGIEYDEMNRPIRYYSPETGTEVRHTYNDVGRVINRKCTRGVEWTFSLGEKNELLAADSTLGSWSYEWDAERYLKSEETPNRKVEFTRDLMYLRTSLEDDTGLRLDYVWDLRSRLVALTVNRRWRYEFVYDGRDLIHEMHFPGGQILSLTYDSMSRMTSRILRDKAGGTIIASRLFFWDIAGRLNRIEDLRLGTREYQSDAGSRLLIVSQNGQVIERYSHDAAGNVLTTALQEVVTVDNGNRATRAGAVTFEYTDDGHLARRTENDRITEYEYDGEDLLIRITLPDGTSIQNSYDFIGRRFRQQIGDRVTRYFWDGEAMQGEQTGEEPPVYYIFLPYSVIPLAIVKDDRIHSLLFDQIGTVTDAFDEDGKLSWSCDMTAFWMMRAEGGSLNQPIRALGQYHDRETGLYYNYFRHYDPWLGRYFSADPVGYTYCQNLYWYSSNPTLRVDTDGLGIVGGNTLELSPMCDWGPEQCKDFHEKLKDLQGAAAGEGITITHDEHAKFKRPCGSAADKWKDDCLKDASEEEKKKEVKRGGDPCKDYDADHRRELCLKGKNDCDNMTPRLATVNRSVGSQVGSSIRDNLKPGQSLTIKSVTQGACRERASGKPCSSNTGGCAQPA